MTTGELIRSARLRAGLTQAELAERLEVPASSIGRWETDTVEPGYPTLRRVLQACGFDLPPVLEPYAPDSELDARIEQLGGVEEAEAPPGEGDDPRPEPPVEETAAEAETPEVSDEQPSPQPEAEDAGNANPEE